MSIADKTGDEVKKLYALHFIPTGGYLGSLGEKLPVGKDYYLYCEEVADERKKNCRYPDEWEVVVSPRQTDWPKEVFYQH